MIAYLYLWEHLPSGIKYLGSRTNKTAHPDDGYICSSYIEEHIINAPHEWHRRIIGTGTPKEIRQRESDLQVFFNMAESVSYFNEHNSNGKFSTAGKAAWNKGLNYSGMSGKQQPESAKQTLSKKRTGINNPMYGRTGQTAAQKAAMAARKGVAVGPYSEARKAAIRAARQKQIAEGWKPWNAR